eukprot:7382784-Prymnesium_polylepis.1
MRTRAPRPRPALLRLRLPPRWLARRRSVAPPLLHAWQVAREAARTDGRLAPRGPARVQHDGHGEFLSDDRRAR